MSLEIFRVLEQLAQLDDQLPTGAQSRRLRITDLSDHRHRCSDDHVGRGARHHIDQSGLPGDQPTSGNDDEAGDAILARRREQHRVGIQSFPDRKRRGDVVPASGARVLGVAHRGDFLDAELSR